MVQSVASWQEVHDIAISHAHLKDGLALEFGVLSGKTVNRLAQRTGWPIHAFDSFQGLPEAWRDGYPQGKFARTPFPAVHGNVTLHPGLFEDSLPRFLSDLGDRARPVRYLHIDSDLYSSAATMLRCLDQLVTSGTVIVFDEHFNYDGWRQGEFKAFQEFIARHNAAYEYLTYNHRHQQVAVTIR